ncbi:MAG: hypothetical protein AAF363_01415 [Bacteroidota bacterium]
MVTTNVIEYISSCWRGEGFEYLRPHNQFRRSIKDGFQSIIVSVSSYDDEVLIDIHLGIRHNKIENMIYPVTKGLKEFESESHTFLTSTGRIQEKLYHRYTIKDEKDLEFVRADLFDFMQTHGLEFLHKMKDLNYANTVFNTFSDYNNQLFYNPYTRAIRGLTVCKLVEGENFTALKETYTEQLIQSGYPDSYFQSFNTLALFLENYSMN